MKRLISILVLVLAHSGVIQANGLLIPSEPELPALAMLNHVVEINIEDQVAMTKVMQTFRNHTDRDLEATYIFPIPKGASVRDFVMWSDGEQVKGEMVSAVEAKSMYNSIIRQTKNPALLDYIGSDLLRLKVFPVKAGADQKIAVSFTSVAKKEHDVVEYIYPLETNRESASTLEEFRITANLKSQQPINNIYSPSHEIQITRINDHEAKIQFEDSAVRLDRDFQIFFTSNTDDIGITALQHRPVVDEDGYVMFLMSPRAELSKSQKVPRDIVFVIDTSGSMRTDDKMNQAKQALKHCLSNLSSDDRFAVINFASTVNNYRDQLVAASESHIQNSKKWVDNLFPSGGTAIHSALMSALKMRSNDKGRMFTVAFFTDGQPTIGETGTNKILADLQKQNSINTRVFSFGLGNDLNAVFLDQLAEQTRAISSYVRPDQNIEAKVSSFFKKIHHPVLANLKLSTGSEDVRLTEVYPPQLPDLFHGDQLVVLARFQGVGDAGLVLQGNIGPHVKDFSYDVSFDQQNDSKPFVEELWARRKVGYLLDQIRINGEQKELVDEVVIIAKRYGITTPYTSYLIMPDAPAGIAMSGGRGGGMGGGGTGRLNYFGAAPAALSPRKDGEDQRKVLELAKEVQPSAELIAGNRNAYQQQELDSFDFAESESLSRNRRAFQGKMADAKRLKSTLDSAMFNYQRGRWADNQRQKLGVDLSLCTNELKCQEKLVASAVRNVCNRKCMEFGGVWIDEAFDAKTKTVVVKAQSEAYFRILERHPEIKDVFRLGNHLVWITPTGTGLVLDSTDGNETMSDQDIDLLFASK